MCPVSNLFDVVAVSLSTHRVRLMAQGKTERDADAIICMAVMRRGVQEEFTSAVPQGMYAEGDEWKGDGRAE